MKSFKDRGRLIKGAFRRVVNDKHVDLENGPDGPEPHDPANDIIDEPSIDDDVVDDAPIPYPPHAMMPQKARLSVSARDLLSGREVIMLCDSYSDDVSSFNDSVYLENFNRPPNRSLVGDGPQAIDREVSHREESILLSDAASFGRNAPARVKSLLVADGPKSEDGSTADKPIALHESHSFDALSDKDGDELSLPSRVMRVKLDEFKNKYQDIDNDQPDSHHEATEVLSASSVGNSHAKDGRGKMYGGLVKRTPHWFRVAVIASIVLLFGAIFLAVIAILKAHSPDDAAGFNTSSDATENTGPLGFGSTESSVASAPSLLERPGDTSPAESTTPKESPGSASPPVEAPMIQSIFGRVTEAPARSPVSPKPTSFITNTPTKVQTTSTPVIEPNGPTFTAPVTSATELPISAPPTMKPVTAHPTVTHSETPTAEPTTAAPSASPTIDTVNKMVIYLTAGSIDESVNLDRFPTRRMTSFLVHLGDWNQEDKCEKEDYAGVTQKFANSSIPVFFVMGDEGKWSFVWCFFTVQVCFLK